MVRNFHRCGSVIHLYTHSFFFLPSDSWSGYVRDKLPCFCKDTELVRGLEIKGNSPAVELWFPGEWWRVCVESPIVGAHWVAVGVWMSERCKPFLSWRQEWSIKLGKQLRKHPRLSLSFPTYTFNCHASQIPCFDSETTLGSMLQAEVLEIILDISLFFVHCFQKWADRPGLSP